MINDSLVTKHFSDVWKKSRIYLENHNGDFYITDTNVIIKIPGNPLQFKLFKSREIFPKLPDNNECFTYAKGPTFKFSKQGPSCFNLIERLLQKNYQPLTITSWAIKDRAKFIQLIYHHETPIFIDTQFFEFFGSTGSWYGTAYNEPIINALKADEITGVIMPVKVPLKPDEIFPAHLNFLVMAKN